MAKEPHCTAPTAWPLTKEHDLALVLDRLDGVILVEGDDMDPTKMGLSPHPSIKTISARRETHDLLLCKLVGERKLPTLGVGLGMQELNVVHGGGLYQNLPEDLGPKGLPHHDPLGGPHRHIVTMEPKSKLRSIYGEGEICVNSYHHQGIRKVAPGFRAPPPTDWWRRSSGASRIGSASACSGTRRTRGTCRWMRN